MIDVSSAIAQFFIWAFTVTHSYVWAARAAHNLYVSPVNKSFAAIGWFTLWFVYFG